MGDNVIEAYNLGWRANRVYENTNNLFDKEENEIAF